MPRKIGVIFIMQATYHVVHQLIINTLLLYAVSQAHDIVCIKSDCTEVVYSRDGNTILIK